MQEKILLDGTHTTGQHATDIDLLHAMDIGGQIATIITGGLATDINVVIKPAGNQDLIKTNYDESQIANNLTD